MNKRTLTLFVINKEKFGHLKMKDINKIDYKEDCSFVEYVEYYLYDNVELIKNIMEAIDKATRNIPFVKEPVFPNDDYIYVINYLNKKLTRCKVDGDTYKQTLSLIESTKNKDFSKQVDDCNIYYKYRNLSEYTGKVKQHTDILKGTEDKWKNAKYLDMSLNEMIEEFSK